MRPRAVFGALALSASAFALSDSFPLLLLSTAKFQDADNHNQIQTSREALRFTRGVLATCPTDRYLVATQPGIQASDFRRPGGCSMPHLCRAAEDSRIKGEFSVAEVVGTMEYTGFARFIESECAKKGKAVTVDEVHLPPLDNEDRAYALHKHDTILAGSLEAVTKSDSYTILFLPRPGEPAYQAEFVESLHMDLKRDTAAEPVRREENDSRSDRLPLFKKYQFFSPGIFTGIIVAVILFSILGVGLRALSSLEVSYGAFEKEMGPAAQKKQQ